MVNTLLTSRYHAGTLHRVPPRSISHGAWRRSYHWHHAGINKNDKDYCYAGAVQDTLTGKHTNSYTHTDTHTHTHTHTHTKKIVHTYTHIHTQKNRTHIHTYTHTKNRTHTHTHTHQHMPAAPLQLEQGLLMPALLGPHPLH